MLISHGLCWSRSAESSTPRPRNRWSRTNTTHGTCPFRLPAGADPVLQNSCKISHGNFLGHLRLLPPLKQDTTPQTAGQSQPLALLHSLQGVIHPLPPPHEGTVCTLCTELLLTWTVLQGFPLATPSIKNTLFSSSSHTSKNWICLLNFFSWSSILHTIFYPISWFTKQLTIPVPPTLQMSRVPRDWHQSWNHTTTSLERPSWLSGPAANTALPNLPLRSCP